MAVMGDRVTALLGGSLSRAALRTSGATIALSMVTLVSNVVITLLLARLMGASGFGVYSFAFAAATLLTVPAVLGMAPLVVRTVAAASTAQEWGRLRGALRRANQAVLVSSATLVGVAALFGLALREARPEVVTAYWTGLTLVPLLALATVRQAAMQGLGRVVAGRVPETLLMPAAFLTLVAVAYSSDSLTGASAVALHVAAAFLALLVGTALLARSLPVEVRRTRHEYDDRAWARALVPLILVNGIGALTLRFDVLLLGVVRGPAEAGVFAVVERAAGLCAFFLTAAAYPMSPLLARLWTAGRAIEMQRVVTQAARLIFAGSLVVAVPLVLFGAPLLGLFGAEFRTGHAALVVLCLGQLVNAGTGVVGLVLMMTGHESEVARSVAVAAATGITASVVLVPILGLIGAATGVTLGLTVLNLTMLYRLRRSTGIWAAAVGRPPVLADREVSM